MLPPGGNCLQCRRGLDLHEKIGKRERLRTYVVDHSPEKLGPVTGEILAFYDGVVPAANTFIGVQALALPDFLVEIEATAAL